MKNTQVIAERIKTQAKCQRITVKKILEECELGPNTVTKMTNGTDIFSQNLVKIADVLGVSVDYLLGRTDEPKTINGNSIKTGDITGDNNANINATKKDSDKEITELAELINGLSLIERAKVVLFIDELKTKNK